jgi:hypothetical protein
MDLRHDQSDASREMSGLKLRAAAPAVAAVLAAAGYAQPAPTGAGTYVVLPSGSDDVQDFKSLLDQLRQPGKTATFSSEALAKWKVELPGYSVDAVAVPAARLERLSDEAFRRINSESASSPSALVEYRDKIRARGRPTLYVNNIFTASNASTATASGTPAELQVNQAMAASFERARINGFSTNFGEYQLLPAAKSLTVIAVTHNALKNFAAAYAETIEAFEAVLDGSADAAAKDRLLQSTRMTFDTFVADWPKLKDDWDARRAAVQALDRLGRQSELKAVYGIKSEFLPETYQSIYLQSARAMGIYDEGGMFVCSAFAVTAEWIMTAGHCFIDRPWENAKVAYSVGGSASQKLSVVDAWPNPPRGSMPDDKIDFAFVRVDPPAELRQKFADLEQRSRAEMGKMLCLRKTPGRFEEPVVVIAQSSSNRLVYDHAYIWYPYALVESEFGRVEAMTGIRVHRFAEAAFAGPAEQKRFFDQSMASFRDAYGQPVTEGTTRRRYYNWQPAEARSKRPMFGFDTDTVSGNSGGAVFGRRDACLVGVFNGGQPDGLTITEASWRAHEFATPIVTVMKELESADAALAVPLSDEDKKRRELVAALRSASF